MFDSSWNSAAYQRFCSEVGVTKNGDRDVWVLYDTQTGNVFCGEYYSEEEAEEARRSIYDEAQ